MEEKKAIVDVSGKDISFNLPQPGDKETLIAFTQTLNPREYAQYTVMKQHKIAYPHLRTSLKTFCKRWFLWPEIQPNSGMLHYHGLLYVTSKAKMINIRPRMCNDLGFVKFETVKDVAGWFKYCTKEVGELTELFPIVPFTEDTMKPPKHYTERAKENLLKDDFFIKFVEKKTI